MEKQVNYYIHFFNDDNENFQIDMEVYNTIYSKVAENDNVFKEERLNDENVIDYTLTLYKPTFFETINEIIKFHINH